MKKTNQCLLLAACVLGVLAFSAKLSAVGSVMPSSFASMTTPMAANASTNAIPDLLKTCPVSGDKLGEMAPPYVFIYKGQEVKLCCKDCKKDFDKDPAKYMKKIRAADKTFKTAKPDKN